MPRSRRRPPARTRPPAQRPTQSLPPRTTPPPLFRRILASWLGRLITVVGIVAAGLALVEFWGTLLPRISLAARSSPPVPFQIENRNPFFGMDQIQLVCAVDSATFASDKGPVGYSIPFTSDQTNSAPIDPGDTATFDCDATRFAGMQGNNFCIAGLCTQAFGLDPSRVHLTNETLRVEMTFRIVGWRRHYLSATFRWDGRNWSEGQVLK